MIDTLLNSAALAITIAALALILFTLRNIKKREEAMKFDPQIRRPNRPPPSPAPSPLQQSLSDSLYEVETINGAPVRRTSMNVLPLEYQHVSGHRDELASCTYYRCADCGGSIYTIWDKDVQEQDKLGHIREKFHKAYKSHQCTPLPATEPTAEPKKEYVRLIRFTAKEGSNGT